MAKILVLVTFNIFPAEMGGQKGVALFHQYLSAHHDLIIAGPSGNKPPAPVKFIPLLFTNRKIYLNAFSISKLSRLVKEQQVDCIIAEHSYAGWIGWLLKRKHRIPLIIHSHNIETERFRQMGRKWWSWYRHFEKWIHRKADHNFFITEEDRRYAIKYFQLKPFQCTVMPYGVQAIGNIDGARERLRTILDVRNEYLLFFNGTLDYYPNRRAVELLVTDILPLLDNMNFAYKLVITGKNLSPSLAQLIATNPAIVYKGFVEDLNLYYQGADLFLNTVLNDAGVKTKLVEALGNGCTVISAASGAKGIDSKLTGDKLIIIAEGDWNGFAEAIAANCNRQKTAIPSAFFDYYSWEKIAARAAEKLNDVIARHE